MAGAGRDSCRNRRQVKVWFQMLTTACRVLAYRFYVTMQSCHFSMPARATFACALPLATVWPCFGRAGEKSHDQAQHMSAPRNGTPGTKASVAAPRLVRFPATLRDRTLANMRDHLLALAEIQDQLAGQHYELAAAIAEQRLGMSSLKLHGAH